MPAPPAMPPSKPAPAPVRGQDQDSSETAKTVNEFHESRSGRREVTKAMEDLNPIVDVTTPDLIDFIITDLGAPLSPTSVSQYLVAQFSS